MPIPHEFFLQVIGKGYDEGYGYQCVAGFKEFCKSVIGVNYYHKSMCYGGNPTGYSNRIWYNFEALGLGQYFDKVAPNCLEDGDWAIWQFGSRPCPYSHIAMFRKDNGNGTGIFLGQNQIASDKKFTQVNISYSGLLGGLRPKVYHQKPKEKVDQYIHPGSHVQIPGTFEVIDINVKNNTSLVRIDGKDYWISSVPLLEVE